jgi:phosphatidylserine/phosphatidylglycerophosphate/cardiolipin synthase-like enzyme
MDNFPSRVEFFQLKSFDYTYPNHDCEGVWTDPSCYNSEMTGYFKKFYVHAKMFIIDDKYMSIGSCNKNNRGYLYEGEMNVSIYDKNWVTTQRKAIFENILGPDNYSEVEAWEAEDFNAMFDKLKEIAQYNQNAYNAWDTDIAEGDEKRDEDFDIDYTSVSKADALPDDYKPKGFLYPLSFDDPSDCLLENVGDDAAK